MSFFKSFLNIFKSNPKNSDNSALKPTKTSNEKHFKHTAHTDCHNTGDLSAPSKSATKTPAQQADDDLLEDIEYGYIRDPQNYHPFKERNPYSYPLRDDDDLLDDSDYFHDDPDDDF